MQSTIAGICRAAALVAIAAGVAACGVDSQEAPSLIGPSGFAQSVTLTASPDRLPRDGSSQAVITVSVRNESGQPVSGQRLSLAATAGTLSQSEVVTGSEGRATFTLTAPAAGTPAPSVIEVLVTPVGGNFDAAVTRSLSIALVGTTNTTAPSPSFTVSPAAPEVHQVVTFDASGTTDEGAACTTTCTFTWNFGDGNTATGRIVQHAFTSVGLFNVTLTVTDSSGSSASITRTVTTAAVDAPTVSVPTVSPSPVIQGHQATLTVSATPATGHRIVQYSWNFGDSTTQITTVPTVVKTYTAAGTFTATVTVTDDLGQVASASAAIQVTSGAVGEPVARFTVTPAQPRVGEQARFDASGTTVGSGSVITSYSWSFGDGTTAVTTTPTINKTYDEARLYPVTLTVMDNLGRVSAVGQQVTVVP